MGSKASKKQNLTLKMPPATEPVTLSIPAAAFGQPGGFFGGTPAAEPVPVKPVFRPEFIEHVVFANGAVTVPVNPQYFATYGTAEVIAKLYGDGVVYQQPFGGVGGGWECSHQCYMVKVGGRFVNAGMLAAYYARNPEDQFPGVADKLIRGALASGI